MHITSFGNSFIKLNIKSPNIGDSVLFIDPFVTKTWGLRQPKMEADVVLFSEKELAKGLTLPKTATIIDEPGEYETREIYVLGKASNQPENKRQLNYFLIEAEDLTIAHLGSTNQTKLENSDIDNFGDIDILFVPVGGNNSLTGKQAANLVKELEPRIVIPIYYKYPGAKIKLSDEKEFLRELGSSKAETTNKFIVRKKDLPSEETKIIIIRP